MKPNSAHLLIDGDVFIYMAAAATEKIINFDGDNCFILGSLTEAKEVFLSKLEAIFSACGSKSFTITLSCDEGNFRKTIYPKYKSNRAGKPRPVVLKFLREWVECNYPCFKRKNLEGDDVLGILATSSVIIKNKTKIVVSVDKDMKTIPCVYYDVGKNVKSVISYNDANYNHMLQTLTGDSADGYPGCAGVGIKTAEKILIGRNSYNSMWEAVLSAYKKAGLSEDDALTQARLARILRNYDYDFKNKTPRMWSIASEQAFNKEA